MAIDIGDAVLTFLGDTTKLDAAFDKVGTEAPAKLAPAEAAIRATGAATDDMAKSFAVGMNGAVELGNVTNLAGEQSRESLYQARGEAALLGEEFGIRLPRHVRSFIAELPGVGTALSAAFSATAILFIIEALAKGVEKITEWANASDEVAKKIQELFDADEKTFQGLENNLLRAQIKLDELTGNHLEALRLKLQLIDNTTLEKLDSEFTKLKKVTDDTFASMDRGWFMRLLDFRGAEEAKDKFSAIQTAVQKALDAHTPEAFNDALKILDKGLQETSDKLNALNKQQNEADNARKNALSGRAVSASGAESVDPETIKSWETLGHQIQSYTRDIQAAQKADEDEKKAAKDEERTKKLTEQAQAAKRTLDARLAGIEQTKLAEQSAFTDGKIGAAQWADAQIKATLDAKKAQDDYRDRLVELAKQGVDGSKAMAVAQDSATQKIVEQNKVMKVAEDAILKAQQETAKLRAEFEKLVFPVEKTKDQTQALKELEAAEKKLEDAQKALALAQVSQDFKQQEAAIKQLASLRIISKEQEAQQLARISKQEEDQALAILKDHLAKEKEQLESARAKLIAAEQDPLTSPEQLTKLRTFFTEKQALVAKAETDVLRAETSSNERLIALDRSHYGQALALAIAFGNQDLARALKHNHDLLVAKEKELQAEQKAVKSKGAITKATNDQIKALEHEIAVLKLEEKTLENTATNGLSKWKQFSAGFRSEAQQNMKTMEDMAKEMQQDAQNFASDLGSEFAAAALGQESAGQAMLHGTEKLIGKMAEQWGEYFAAKAIADVFWNPAQAAAEFAAATALFTLGGILGGLASGSSKSSSASASSGTAAPAAGSAALSAGSQPTQTVNVPHLSGGGLVMQDTLAVVHGGEGVLPLNNRSAMRQIAGEIAAQINAASRIQGGGGRIELCVHTDVGAQAKLMSQAVRDGRAHLVASDSKRHTPRS